MKNYRQNLGDWGEKLAKKYLEKIGYQIIDQKWRKKEGEIDLIALDKNVLVFIEVKTRKSDKFGTPAESITEKKQEKMVKCIQRYLEENCQCQQLQIRLDIILIKMNKRKVHLEHLKNPVENPT